MCPQAAAPLVSVVLAAHAPPASIEQALASLAEQRRSADIEVLLCDGSDDGRMAALCDRFQRLQHLHVPGGNLPALKGAGVRVARGELVAMLDPSDAAEPDWVDQILAAFEDATVSAVGGAVVLDGPRNAGNVAAYLFEYGAFNPPFARGDTPGDLPGNNVAYRRNLLTDVCADILASEGFNKPFFHERIRATGGRFLLQPSMRVRHLTQYAFVAFATRRFHYGRCFGAVRVKRASPRKRLFLRASAPLVPLLLVARHLRSAARHPENRRLLPGAALALCGVSAFWGIGEWLGCWLGAGESCRKLV
jgi:glycosyltransferase involved in cell wall biosynthesis